MFLLFNSHTPFAKGQLDRRPYAFSIPCRGSPATAYLREHSWWMFGVERIVISSSYSVVCFLVAGDEDLRKDNIVESAYWLEGGLRDCDISI